MSSVRIRILIVLLTACVSVVLAEPQDGSEQSPRPDSLKSIQIDIRYGPHARNLLDLYLARSEKPTPLVFKERLDRLGIECIVQFRDPKSGEIVRHGGGELVTPVEFISRQFQRMMEARTQK